MSDYKKLREVIETNFRLNALQSRELSAQVNADLAEVSSGLKSLSSKVGRLGAKFSSATEQNAVREQETLDAIRQILDNSVDLHKTTADHERRIRRLEDRAS